MSQFVVQREEAEQHRAGRFRRASPVEAPLEGPVADGRFEYAVDRVRHTPVSAGRFERDLSAALATRAEAGWRAMTILPQDGGDALVVFERPADASQAGAERAEAAPPAASPERPAGPWPSPHLLREAATPAPSAAPAAPRREEAVRVTPAVVRPAVIGGSRMRRWRERPLIAVATASGLTAALALALIASDRDASAPTSAAAPQTRAAAPQTRAAAPVPACASVASSASGPLTCTTRSGVLTIASGTTPLLLDDLQLRALEATRTRTTATVRARVRNTGRTPLTVSSSSGVYLVVGGRRVASPAAAPPVTLAAGQARTVRLRFRLDPNARRALARTQNRVDLGVRDPRATGTSRRGAVRLRLGR